jgi:hypothetical protein
MAITLAVRAGIQLAIPFLKKHPWIIPVAIIAPLLLIALFMALVFGSLMGLSMIKLDNGERCEDGSIVSSVDVLPEDLSDITDFSSLVTSCEQTPVYGGGDYVLPANGQITAFFGTRAYVSPVNGNMHYGLDISGGDYNIYAAADGVLNVKSYCSMTIDHGNGITTGYLHMDPGNILVPNGTAVKKGQLIATQGNSCGSVGRHLHFEVMVGGLTNKVDPVLFYLQSGINIPWQNKVNLGLVYAPTKNGYCAKPESKYFYWCPGFVETELTPAGTAVVTTPQGAQEFAHTQVISRDWSEGDFTCLVNLWNRESEWKVDAMNPSSGAYGIPQSLPGSKMATAGADWQTNPNTQITWGLNYISGRYGTPCAAWAHSESVGWY